jgi:hypothetical protein
MNPIEGCFKGYKKCRKGCYEPERCRACLYINQCCHGYCLYRPANPKIKDDQTKGEILMEYLWCPEKEQRRSIVLCNQCPERERCEVLKDKETSLKASTTSITKSKQSET